MLAEQRSSGRSFIVAKRYLENKEFRVSNKKGNSQTRMAHAWSSVRREGEQEAAMRRR
jgi:hypothetical protein